MSPAADGTGAKGDLRAPFVLYIEDFDRWKLAIWLEARATGSDCKNAESGDPRGFPWDAGALRDRVACLTRIKSQRLPAAQRDLERFERQSPTPVGGR